MHRPAITPNNSNQTHLRCLCDRQAGARRAPGKFANAKSLSDQTLQLWLLPRVRCPQDWEWSSDEACRLFWISSSVILCLCGWCGSPFLLPGFEPFSIFSNFVSLCGCSKSLSMCSVSFLVFCETFFPLFNTSDLATLSNHSMVLFIEVRALSRPGKFLHGRLRKIHHFLYGICDGKFAE